MKTMGKIDNCSNKTLHVQHVPNNNNIIIISIVQ